MNDVKDLCRRILDKPAPPMPDSAQVVAIARRAVRQRVRLTIAASSLAIAAILAITTASVFPQARPPVPQAAAVGLPQTPARTATDAHGVRIAQLLTAALPAGYTSRTESGDRGTSTWIPADRSSSTSDSYVSRTQILVSKGDGEGALSVTIIKDNAPTSAEDLCSSTVAARLTTYLGVTDLNCAATTSDGMPIRTATAAGNTLTATRFLADGLLAVRWNPNTSTISAQPTDAAHPWSRVDDHGQKPLTTSPFTVEQLVDLAANPQMLP